MTHVAPTPPAEPRVPARLLAAIACVSAALIAYQIVLMRRLLLEHWHHLGYLVISVALLGFGVSGTLVWGLQGRVRARPRRVFFWLSVALLVVLAACPRLAGRLPVTARFIPEDLWVQVGWWAAYFLLALAPFLTGATFLGATLLVAGSAVGRVYAANLAGSAAGAVAAVLVISRFPLAYALWPSLALTCGAALLLAPAGTDPGGAEPGRRPHARPAARASVALCLLLALLALAGEWRWPLRPAYDEHKYAARLEQLVRQGDARRVARAADPYGYVELYESELFHDLPFLSLRRPPPPMYGLVVNGDPGGSVLRIDEPAQAEALDGTLMAFPYRLVPPRPRVLLLGETGGVNVWLARRRGAAAIDVVQPNAALVRLVREAAPRTFDRAAVHVTEARRFVRRACPAAYDLIQIVALEGLGAGAGGMRGLAEDHLVTVAGLADCLRATSDNGVVVVSRGVEEPARENVRLFATFVEALEALGVREPGRHLIQVRDYLGVCTIAAKRPLTDERRAQLRAALADFGLTPVWYAGLPADELNQPDALSGPPGTAIDWFHHAAVEILSPRRAAFYEAWLLNVRPAHDDRPFFWDFFKPAAVGALRRAYGELWLTRAELGRLFLYVSLVIVGGAAVAFILVPLAVFERRRGRSEPSPAAPRAAGPATIVYFTGIGVGFMSIEMALISRAIHWLGEPVLASALVIGGVLVLAGLGSLTGARLCPQRAGWSPLVVVAALTLLLRWWAWQPPTGDDDGGWLALLAAVPLAYFMGVPMPGGIAALDRAAPRWIPWAWGVNGVASVLATSLAILIAMTAGYRTVVLLAVAAYALAALAAPFLARRPARPAG